MTDECDLRQEMDRLKLQKGNDFCADCGRHGMHLCAMNGSATYRVFSPLDRTRLGSRKHGIVRLHRVRWYPPPARGSSVPCALHQTRQTVRGDGRGKPRVIQTVTVIITFNVQNVISCIQKMRTVGNIKANQHWEAKLPIYWPRPTPNARM